MRYSYSSACISSIIMLLNLFTFTSVKNALAKKVAHANSGAVTLVVVAMKEESNGLFEKIISRYPNSQILYTSIGMPNAAYELTKRIYCLQNSGIKIKRIVNLGSAGGRHPYKVGEVVECSDYGSDVNQTEIGMKPGVWNKTSKYKDDKIPYIKGTKMLFPKSLRSGVCCSEHSFGKDKTILARCKIMDMEAYALAKVALREGIQFSALKYIANKDGCGSGDDFNNNVYTTGKLLTPYLQEILQLT